MDDSVFHIVERSDGQFQIVQLERIKMNSNSKLRGVISPECDSEKGKLSSNEKQTPRISALKNYSRVRKTVNVQKKRSYLQIEINFISTGCQ